MPALYEIIGEIRELLDLETDDGELPTLVEERLDELQHGLNDKVDGVVRFVKLLEAETDGYKKEAERLTRLATINANKSERLKRYVKASLEEAGITSLKTCLFKVGIQKNSRPSIRVAGEADVPPEFARVRVELDGNAAYEAWKAGNQLPASLIVEQGTHLRIR